MPPTRPRRPRTAIGALLALAALSIHSLVTASPLLAAPLPGGLPAGNALAWLALCGLSGAAVLLASHGSRLRRTSVVVLIVAAFWLPVSAALAGNLALNFSGALGSAWLYGSVGLSMAVLAVLSLAVLSALFTRGGRA